MPKDSIFALRRTRPNWWFPLLASIPIYFRRLVFVAVIVPCAVPLGLIFVSNAFSITATTETVLELAAGSGTDPHAFTLRYCDDEFARSGEGRFSPHLCTSYRTESVPIKTLAAQMTMSLSFTYAALVLFSINLCWGGWRPTPLGRYFKRSRKAAPAARASSDERGDTK